MKLATITLTTLAVVLAIITYLALFSGPQMIQPNAVPGGAQVAQGSTQATSSASSTATSSAFVGNNASNTVNMAQQGYQATFSAPYPITWIEGGPQLAIAGAALDGGQLVLNINIQMSGTAQCVPVNLRLIADELGTMQVPDAPATANYPLAADGNNCQGSAETAYSQTVTFTINPATVAPFLISTGDPANPFFEIATTTAGGLQVTVPGKNG